MRAADQHLEDADVSKDDADAKAARERQSTALGAVVGRNVRRIREERLITQGELGDLWKAHGLNWARSKISALESGHRPQISAAELFLMAVSLQVTVPGLLAIEGLIRLEPYDVDMEANQAMQLLAGDQSQSKLVWSWAEGTSTDDSWKQLSTNSGESEAATARWAKLFNMDAPLFIDFTRRVFDGLTLTEERNRQLEGLGDVTFQQRTALRGHVTRRLLGQLEQFLEHHGADIE